MKQTRDEYLKDFYGDKYNKTKESYKEQRRHQGKPKDICIAILGDGCAGLDIVRTLSEMNPIYEHTRISKIILYSSDPDRTAFKFDFEVNPEMVLEYCSYKELKNKKNESHITIVTRDNRELNGMDYIARCLDECIPPQRLILGRNNIERIIEVAELMQEYNGLVLMVSNHVNLLSSVFQRYSRLDPRQIVGISHTDTYRLRKKLEERIKLNTEDSKLKDYISTFHSIEAFVIGLHDINMVPVFSEAYVLGGININRLDFFDPNEIYDSVVTEGFKQFMALRRLPSPAIAVNDVVKAVLDEMSCVSNAVYVDFTEPIFDIEDRANYISLVPERGTWIGLPHFFWDFRVEILPRSFDKNLLNYAPENVMDWFSRLHPVDKQKFFKGANECDTILKGWESESLIKHSLIEAATRYYFVGDTNREKTLSAKIREELQKERQVVDEKVSEKLASKKQRDPEKIRQALASGGLDKSTRKIVEEAEREKMKQKIRDKLKKSEEP